MGAYYANPLRLHYFLALILLFVLGTAEAGISPKNGYIGELASTPNKTDIFDTYQQVCSAIEQGIKGWDLTPYSYTNIKSAKLVACQFNYAHFWLAGDYIGANGLTPFECKVSGCNYGALTVNIREVYNACPANSSLSNGSCICKAGYSESNGSCKSNKEVCNDKWKTWCTASAGQNLGFRELKGRSVLSGCQQMTLAGSPIETPGYSAACAYPTDAGCGLTLSNAKSFPDADGSWYTQGDAVGNGATCVGTSTGTTGTPDGTTSKEPAKDPPCKGGYAGMVNGTQVCAKPDPTNGVDWTGSQTSTNSDGSRVTRDTLTRCNGTSCSTTTTITNRDPAGNVTGSNTSTTTGSLNGLCASDPGNGACGDKSESSFGGDCAAGFKVRGDDAVLNAMALEQHKRDCTFFGKDTDASSTANVAKSGADGKNTDAMKAAASQVNVGLFDASGSGWSRSCPANPSFVIPWGTRATFEIPFSRICGPLGWLANAGVALTLMGCLVWVLGGSRKK